MAAHDRPIADYGIIGNCETAALVNSSGGIDWLCLPAFDAPSFFGALLDREKGGTFTFQPTEQYRTERSYLHDSAILQTRFLSRDATILLTDFFVIARKRRARFYDFTSLHPTRKLVRLFRLEKGSPCTVDIRLAARPDYALRSASWKAVPRGFACSEARLFANFSLAARNPDIVSSLRLEPGHSYFVVLDYGDARTAPNLNEVEQWLEITESFWKEWNSFNYYRGPHAKLVRRSAVTLKLLTYAPTGAVIAALTTSLPEKIGGDGNWDYRFTWLRDTGLLINTLFRLGYSGEAKAYLNFIAQKHCQQTNGTRELPVLLPIRDRTRLEEETLEHLSGYGDSRPVRRGNHASDDLQLDNFGYLLQSLFFWKKCGGKLDQAKRRMACDALATLRERWREPDNGIWEGAKRKQHTQSKAGAWLAFERGRDLGLMDEKEAVKLGREIFDETLKRGVLKRNGRHYLADSFEGDVIDCSAFLAFTTGFLPEALARTTREEIERRLLAVAPWLYRSDWHRDSGEGAFVVCSFWWVTHLIRENDLTRAEELLTQLIQAASPLGLYSEEIDPHSGEFLGNFPQAFSHLGLITALLDLQRATSDPSFARLSEHEKFQRSVGPTIGLAGVIAGFARVPKTARLLFSNRSKWRM